LNISFFANVITSFGAIRAVTESTPRHAMIVRDDSRRTADSRARSGFLAGIWRLVIRINRC